MACHHVHLVLTILMSIHKVVRNEPVWLQRPPNPVFALLGSDAVFQWNYTAGNTKLLYGIWGPVHESGKILNSFALQDSGKQTATVFTRYQSSVSWKRKAVLVLLSVSQANESEYGCELNFESGKVLFHTSKLNVLDLIRPDQDKTIMVSQNELGNANLSSYVGARYSPRFEWLHNSKPLTYAANMSVSTLFNVTAGKDIHTSSIVIYKIHRNAAGMFQLIAVFGELRVQVQKFQLVVRYPPGNSTALNTKSGKYIIQKSTSVTLVCTADSVPTSTFIISKDGVEISKNKIGHFTISSMKLSDEGKYKCVPENDLGQGVQSDVTVSYGERPESLIPGRRMNISSDQASSITCQFNARPPSNVTWFKDGKMLPSDIMVFNKTVKMGHLYVTISNLSIQKPGADHPGLYKCVAENVLGTKEVVNQVTVFYPPTFYADGHPINVSVLIGSTAMLRCRASSYPGTVHYTWFFNSKIVNGHERKSHGNLTIVNATLDNAGLYVCYVSNDIANTQGIANLAVHVMPKLTEVSQSKTLKSGEKIIIKCKATGIPQPSITWRRAQSTTILHVGEVYEIDSRGMGLGSVAYECEAKNAAGVVKQTIHVSVTGISQKVTAGNKSHEWLIPFLIVLCIVLIIVLILIALRRRTRSEPEEASETNGIPKAELYRKNNEEPADVKDEMGLVNPVFVDGAALDNQGTDKMTLNPIYMNEAHGSPSKFQEPKISDGTTIATKYMVYLPNDEDIDKGREEIEVSMVLSSEESEEVYTNEAFDVEGYVSVSHAGGSMSSTDGSLKHFVGNWSNEPKSHEDNMDRFVDGLFDFPEKEKPMEDHKF